MIDVRTLVTDRPLILFDLESTGRDPLKDRIVELGFIILKPGVEEAIEWQSLINPEMPIPHEASHGDGGEYKGHGITDQMVQACRHCQQTIDVVATPCTSEDGHRPYPTFKELSAKLAKGFSGVDFGGFNLNTYDLPLIKAEFERCKEPWDYNDAYVVDGFRIWQVGQPRTLSDAAEYFLGKKHEGAHRALDDIKITLEVLGAQLAKYTDLPHAFKDLHAKQWPAVPGAVDPKGDPRGQMIWKDGAVIVNFGKKWKGLLLTRMTQRDLRWIAKEATGVSPGARKICAEAAEGRFPVAPKE